MRAAAIDDASIAVLVSLFYGRVREDALIGPVFTGAIADWDAHLALLEAFWSSVMLTSGRYKGNPFGAHAGRPLTPAMFDRWLAIWAKTAREVFEPEPAGALIDRAGRIARSLQLGLFSHDAAA